MKVYELMEWLAAYDRDQEITIDFSDSGSGQLACRNLRDLEPEFERDEKPCLSLDITDVVDELRRHGDEGLGEVYQSCCRADALAGVDIDYHWWHRPSEDLTIDEWCAAWRRADVGPELTGPVRLYRGGGTPQSMSWTDNPGVALAFANHIYLTTSEYEDVLGPVRLPVWRCDFPAEAVLGVLEAEHEYIIDVVRFPPVGATRHEPTAEDVAAYREWRAPMLSMVS